MAINISCVECSKSSMSNKSDTKDASFVRRNSFREDENRYDKHTQDGRNSSVKVLNSQQNFRSALSELNSFERYPCVMNRIE